MWADKLLSGGNDGYKDKGNNKDKSKTKVKTQMINLPLLLKIVVIQPT